VKSRLFCSKNVFFGNVYDYYYSLDDEDFIDRIIKCMDVYKAPYKGSTDRTI
jgi:hypothetical protein